MEESLYSIIQLTMRLYKSLSQQSLFHPYAKHVKAKNRNQFRASSDFLILLLNDISINFKVPHFYFGNLL